MSSIVYGSTGRRRASTNEQVVVLAGIQGPTGASYGFDWKGTWEIDVQYRQGDGVVGPDGFPYVLTASSSLGEAPADYPLLWDPLLDESVLETRQPRSGWTLPYTMDFDNVWNPGTATLTIGLVPENGTDFSFYVNGQKFIKYGTQTITITEPTQAAWYVYYDETGTLVKSTDFWDLKVTAPVAYCYFNGEATPQVIVYDERHTVYRDAGWHASQHFGVGTFVRRSSDFGISGYNVTSPATNADVTPDIATGVIYDEDIAHQITALNSAAGYTLARKKGANAAWVLTEASTVPYFVGTTYPQYNQYTGGAWQLTELAANRFVIYTVFITPGLGLYKHLFVPGEAVYTTLTAAQAALGTLPSLGDLLAQEIVAVYQIILRSSASNSSTGKADIQQVYRVTQTKAQAQPADPALYVKKAGDTMTGALLLPGGSAADPSFSFSGDTNTGMYSGAGDAVDFACGGNIQARISTNSLEVIAAARIGFSGDLSLYRDAAGVLAQRNGVNAQAFRIYNTYTDSSNYERGEIYWDSNYFVIGSKKAGTGTARDVVIQRESASDRIYLRAGVIEVVQNGNGSYNWSAGSHYPAGDAVPTLGGAANRWKALYVGGAAAMVPVLIKLHASQTANALEVKSSADANLFAIGATGGAFLPDGTKTSPSLAFMSQTNTGIFYASNSVRIVTSGTSRFHVDSARVRLNDAMAYEWAGGSDAGEVAGDLKLFRDAANILAQRNGANAQAFRVYNTYTDASNYESATIGWVGNQLEIRTNYAGTGAARSILLTANNADIYSSLFAPVDDGARDLGKAALRWRASYFGGASASVPITIKLHASQTANALEVKNSSGTVIFSVNKDGKILETSMFRPYRAGANIPSPASSKNWHIFIAPRAMTVQAIKAIHVDGTSVTINVGKNGTSTKLLASDYTTTTSWASAGAVQNGTLAANDYLLLMIGTVSGSVSQVAVQLDIMENA